MSNRPENDHLGALHEELRATGPRLSPEEREHLESLLGRLEPDRDAADRRTADSHTADPHTADRHTAEHHTADPGVVDSLNEAAERFEVRHPSLSAALRTIGVSLANVGI
ncbi:DUF4404 family protein [Streptomyces sp. NPDC101733]|uniref:DUF4404 family protein n=1 Tax=unclassified Streptomyces TaxID=2593676 RepID=UPI003804593F